MSRRGVRCQDWNPAMIHKLRAFAAISTVAMTAAVVPTLPAADAQTFRCNGEVATIVGTNGDDVLRGTAGRDVIQARGGNDKIYGLAGNDLICGAGGADFIGGGGGNDLLLGGDGNDDIVGGDGADRLQGNNGNDRLRGVNGNDFHNGGLGRDTCEGGFGRDLGSSCEVRKAIYRPVTLASGTLSLAPNRSKTYFIFLDRGDWFSMDFDNPSNFGSAEFPNFDGTWALYDGFGSKLESEGSLIDTNDPIKILNSGAHRLVLTAKPTTTANFTFAAYRSPVAIRSLALNRRVSGSLNVPGETHRWRFSAAGGNMVDVDFANATIDFRGRWWLVKVGRPLSEAVAKGAGYADKNDIRIPSNGQYDLVLRGVSSSTPNYSVTVRR